MNVRALAADMLETMHAANGVGLAAQQVGEALQLTVLDVSQVEDRPSTLKLNGSEVDPIASMPLVLINPELDLGEEKILGIRRLPQLSGHHGRHRCAPITVTARAKTLEGEEIAIEASGLLARAIAARSRSSQWHSLYRSDEFRGQSESCESIETNAKRERAIAGKILANRSDRFVIDRDRAEKKRITLR